MADPILNAVANEARLKTAQIAETSARSYLKGLEDATLALAPLINAAQARSQAATTSRQAVQDDTGTVISDGFGPYSSIDTILRKERFAGKGASIDYIKANPSCSEADAETAWRTAAMQATGLPFLIVPVSSYSTLYRMNLLALGMIPEATYEAQRAWIFATPREVIMGA